MMRVVKLEVNLFTYDEQDGSSTNEVTFEALFYYPSSCVDIQSSQDLARTTSALHHKNTVQEATYIIQDKNLS
jgi:hypothetical protein